MLRNPTFRRLKAIGPQVCGQCGVCYGTSSLKKKKKRPILGCRTGQQVKTIVDKHDYLSLIPRTLEVKELMSLDISQLSVGLYRWTQ